MSIPIDDDRDLALEIRLERLGVLIGRLADLQFAEQPEPEKHERAVQSAALFVEQEYRDMQEERDYFLKKDQAERQGAADE